MRHVQQNHTVTVTMSLDEWLTFNHVRRLIDTLYSQYFSQGKMPGIMDGPKLWNQIMEAWGAFRKAQGIR